MGQRRLVLMVLFFLLVGCSDSARDKHKPGSTVTPTLEPPYSERVERLESVLHFQAYAMEEALDGADISSGWWRENYKATSEGFETAYREMEFLVVPEGSENIHSHIVHNLHPCVMAMALYDVSIATWDVDNDPALARRQFDEAGVHLDTCIERIEDSDVDE